MADNVTLPGTGEIVATDDIGGRQYQRLKLTDGLADSEVHARVLATNANEADAGLVVRIAPQQTWSVSFTNVNASALDSPQMVLRRQGTGVTVSQAAGNLNVLAGTTANAEFLARSVPSFNGAMIQRHQFTASQRIANNNFAVLLADRIGEGLSCVINSATSITVTLVAHGFTAANVGQSMMVGAITGANGVPGRWAIASIPTADTIAFTVAGWPASGSCTVDLFGWNYSQWLYTGATATVASFDAQRNGWNSGLTSPTVLTSASPGHMAQTAIDGRNIYYADALVASAAAPNVVSRGHRVVNIPDSDRELFLYLWSYNGTTAPASSTTWTVGFVAVEETVNLPVYFAGARPVGTAPPLHVTGTMNAGSGTMAVSLATNTPTLAAGTNLAADVGMQYRATAAGGATPVNVNCPATPAVQTIKAAAGRLLSINLTNTNAAPRFLKVWNTASAGITLGTTAALFERAIPANGVLQFTQEGGLAFGTAINIAITGGQGLTNNAVVTAGDVTGFIGFA